MNSYAISILCMLILGALLLTACLTDIRNRRISNKLILIGLLVGIALQVSIPAASGLFSPNAGGLGFVKSIYGFLTAFLIFFPLYSLRTLGAGDVKLLSMIGVFLGPIPVLGAILLTFIFGGVLAIAVAIWNGIFFKTIKNASFIASNITFNILHNGARLEQTSHSKINLPYALAITLGTITQVVLLKTGNAFLG